jgi:hypothetical protein
MSTIDLDKIEKLPKWAQDHIRHLTRTVEALESKHAPHSESKVTWGFAIDKTMRTGHIPDQVPVRWMVDEKLYYYFDVRLEENNLLYVSGNPLISIEPSAANSIRIKLRDR